MIRKVVDAVFAGVLGSIVAYGCVGAESVVRPSRDASNLTAQALVVAQKLELARLRTLARRGMASCERDDVPCRESAVHAAFDLEKPRIEAINKAVATQREVAESLLAYDACASGDDVQRCEARAVAVIMALAPELAKLIDQVRKEQGE